MPEPITLIVGGIALYTWLKKPAPALHTSPAAATAHLSPIALASGTGSSAPLATTTSVVNGVPLAAAHQATPIPSLVTALDNDSALMFRAYVALNPQDFQVFLDRYATNIQLHDDLFFAALTNPPQGGYQPTPGMVASMGLAAYKMVQALNGVAVGRYGDLFGATASAAGAIPGVSPQLVQSLQALTLGYRAFTAGVQAVDTIGALALANGVSFLDMTAALFGGGGSALTVGLAAPIASLSGLLMGVGLVIDIGMTIAGDAPDVQKAIDVALDVASLVCLFIPVVGWVIAIVIQLVKFIIDLFGQSLFGGMTVQQRNLLRQAEYAKAVSPMLPQIADAYTPRELLGVLVAWGADPCGRQNPITGYVNTSGQAMGFFITLHRGDQFTMGGRPFTIPYDVPYFPIGAPGCYFYTGAQPPIPGVDVMYGYAAGADHPGYDPKVAYPWVAWGTAQLTFDEIAIILATYTRNGAHVEATVAIPESMKAMFNTPTDNLLDARTQPMANFLHHGVSLDQIDQIALEYRAQPHLHDLSASFGYATWQDMLAVVVAKEWAVFNWTVSHGSLHDFAVQNGYRTMFAFRAAAFASFETYYTQWQQATAILAQRLTTVLNSFATEQAALSSTSGIAP